MAAHWSLREPWGVLSGWDSSCISAWICDAFERAGSVVWIGSRLCYAIYVARDHHISLRLGETGTLFLC